jgi:hypothetical protein
MRHATSAGLTLTVTPGRKLARTTSKRPLASRFGDMVLWGSFGDATYRAVLTSLVYDRGATRITGAYTLAWARSEFGAVSTSDYPDSAAYRMQRSDDDERHRLVLSGLIRGPFGFQLSTIAMRPGRGPLRPRSARTRI